MPTELKQEAEAERAALAVTPRTVPPVSAAWTRMYGAFVKDHKKPVSDGLVSGDATSKALGREVVKAYGGLDRVPATIDVAVAAAALQLAGPMDDAFVDVWIAHGGLAFAIECFAASTGDRVAGRALGGGRILEAVKRRSLASLFVERTDKAIHRAWLGASEDARVAARARLTEVRATSDLLRRSAIASCVLDAAWIDEDLAAGGRAMLSPQALLVATRADAIAAYLGALADPEDQDFFTFTPALVRNPHRPLRGWANVERFGTAGIDIVVAQLATYAVRLEPNTHGPYAPSAGGAARELLAVARTAKGYLPAVRAAVGVLEAAARHKFTKADDPQPAAYAVVRDAPAVALPLVTAIRAAWAKALVPELQRAAPVGDAKPAKAAKTAPKRDDDAREADVPAALRAQHAFAVPAWLAVEALSPVQLGGQALPARHVPALLGLLALGDREAIVDATREATRTSLAAFGWDVFQAWLTSGAPAKDKWAFTALGVLGDDGVVRKLAPLIRAWPGESQHKRAVAGLDVLVGIGTDLALVTLDGIAQKVKFRALQTRARETIAEVAAARGLTADELGDRLVPDLALDPDGSRTLAFGARTLRVAFTAALEAILVDPAADNRVVKTAPKPAAEDWATLKKDAKTVGAIQRGRYEAAMSNGRRWRAEEARALIIEHPLLRHLARRVVWATYAANGGVQRTFVVDEGGRDRDRTGAAVEVAADARVGIVHALQLAPAELAAWRAWFAERDVAQPFAQLDRETYALAAGEGAATTFARFAGVATTTAKLSSLLSRGWFKGFAQDNGSVYDIYRPISDELRLAIAISPGIHAASYGDYVDPNQVIESVGFERAGVAVELGELAPAIVSDAIREVTRALTSA